MKVKVLGSTQMGYVMPKEEALSFAGKAAGICYMPDDFEVILNEPQEKTLKRAQDTLNSGHHSVFDHVYYNLLLENVPKILAMILNNEGIYTTSEKSARYTKMEPSPEELALYNKWLEKFVDLITKEYGDRYIKFYKSEKKASTAIKKMAQENARYMISVFTNTTLEYTVSLRQLNYILSFFDRFITEAENTAFNVRLKNAMSEFANCIPIELKVSRLNANLKDRKLSIFDERKNRKEFFSETYCTVYKATFAEFAQAQRHRTLWYKVSLLDEFEFYTPIILKDKKELSKEWAEDIKSVAHLYPQGMLISVCERGTYENFILKCSERLCGCAQLEIALQTKETLDKYLKALKENGEDDIYLELLKCSKGARCTFPKFTCDKPCIWGAKDAFNRKI